MPAEKIQLTVNKVPYTVEIEGWEMLLDVLRDRIGLTPAPRSSPSRASPRAPGSTPSRKG